jgi:hypothetical protein
VLRAHPVGDDESVPELDELIRLYPHLAEGLHLVGDEAEKRVMTAVRPLLAVRQHTRRLQHDVGIPVLLEQRANLVHVTAAFRDLPHAIP